MISLHLCNPILIPFICISIPSFLSFVYLNTCKISIPERQKKCIVDFSLELKNRVIHIVIYIYTDVLNNKTFIFLESDAKKKILRRLAAHGRLKPWLKKDEGDPCEAYSEMSFYLHLRNLRNKTTQIFIPPPPPQTQIW